VSQLPPLDFLAVGHLTADLAPDGRVTPGGAVTYGALTAAALGLRAGVVTRADPRLAPAECLPGVLLHVIPAAASTTFINEYDAGHRRTQRVAALAPALAPGDVPVPWRRVPVALFGAVAHELGPAVLDGVAATVLGLGPQGWLRHFGPDGRVSRGPWLGPSGLLGRADAVFLSEEDLEGEPRGEAWFAARAELLVVTAGAAGARARRRDQCWRQPALPARAVDATGAGDAFAAAFCIRLAETGEVPRALRFAAATAAFVVESSGPTGLPNRGEVLARAGGDA
jgi:sugar/nucleoside kinase (ribokinase family)